LFGQSGWVKLFICNIAFIACSWIFLHPLQQKLLKAAYIIFFLLIIGRGFAQSDSVAKAAQKANATGANAAIRPDTPKGRTTAAPLNNDTFQRHAADSLKTTLRDSSIGVNPVVADKLEPLRWSDDTVFAHFLTFTHADPGKAFLINEGQDREPEGKEQLFYILAGLVLFVGIIRTAYPKYFQDIFRLFIQTSHRQKQTPEQIVQGYVPGFLFNVLFLMVGGMLITLYGIKIKYLSGPVWLLGLYCAGVLGGIYLVKYTITALAGWVFNVKDAAGMYSFIVFIINRVIGIILLPVLILISFYTGDANTVLFTIAVSIVFFLLVYRYALSLTVIRKNLKVSALHFFIYLCAVELMPLLVIYKELFNQVHSK